MSTKTVTRSSATFSRVPTSGWFTLGKSSGGTNQNAQITFPALGIAGVINSVKLYIPWNCTTAGEGFSAAGAMVATVGGVPYNFTMSGMTGTAVVTLSSGGWSNSAAFTVDLRAQSGAGSSTSKGCDQDVYLSVDYISEPAPTPPPVYTPSTVTGDTINLDWGDGSDSRGIFAPSQLMYEIQVSLDGGGSWGTLYDTQPGVSFIGFNFASYVGYSAGNDYYNGSVLFRVRTRTPEFNGGVYRSDWTTSGTFAIDYRYSSGAPGATTPSTVGGDTVTFDWADVGSQNGVYGASGMSYELVISLDGGASWGGILGTGAGSSQLTVNLRSYIGVPAGRYYLNPNCRFAVRSVSPNGHRSGWGYSGNFAVDYRIAPSQPAAPALSKANPYEGETITVTVNRPAAYNTQDAGGATNQLTYIVWSDTTEVVRGTAPCTQGSISLALGIGPWTTGRDDLTTGLTVLVRDSMSLDSPWSARTALTVRRYRAPVAVVTTIPRTATTATINLAVSDTGYGGTQASNQVRRIQYKLDSGNWTTATLGTWNGLNNAFALSGLTAGARYGLQVKAFNAEPITGLGDKEGAAYAATVLEFSPVLFPWYDTATGGSGTATKALVVGDDFAAAVSPGWISAQNGISVKGRAVMRRDKARYHPSDGSPANNLNNAANEMGFSYAGGTNSFTTGPFISFGGLQGDESSYLCQIQSTYSGSPGTIGFRTRNGDTGTWNAWAEFWHSGNVTPFQANYGSTVSAATLNNASTLADGHYLSSDAVAGLAGAWRHYLNLRHRDGNGFGAQIMLPYGGYGEQNMYWRTSNGASWTNTRKVWDDGNFNPYRIDIQTGGATGGLYFHLNTNYEPNNYEARMYLDAAGDANKDTTRLKFLMRSYSPLNPPENEVMSLSASGILRLNQAPSFQAQMLGSTDLNAFYGSGYQNLCGFFWNAPNAPCGYGFLECMYYDGTNFAPVSGGQLITIQRVTAYDASKVYIRRWKTDNQGAAWSAWVALN